jgi:DNA-binding CsgD family transcriptional regulator
MGERGRPKYPDVLTPRQYEVLELIREGLTNPQIAERLGISPDGAKWHVKEILWKLDAPSREEAARRDVGREKFKETVASARLTLQHGGWRLRRPPSGRCRFRCARLKATLRRSVGGIEG